jgi:adenine C2-methylase RlmN of 23S rRNA A2503 and tRNA A37
MKKVLVVLVLVMAVLAVNAQTTAPAAKEKSVSTPVMVADLQKAITDNIAKDYVGYTIKEATSVTSEDGTVKYKVVVVKGTTTETLVYDKEGKFVKKLPPVSEK